jgi:hypothetical protein
VLSLSKAVRQSSASRGRCKSSSTAYAAGSSIQRCSLSLQHMCARFSSPVARLVRISSRPGRSALSGRGICRLAMLRLAPVKRHHDPHRIQTPERDQTVFLNTHAVGDPTHCECGCATCCCSLCPFAGTPCCDWGRRRCHRGYASSPAAMVTATHLSSASFSQASAAITAQPVPSFQHSCLQSVQSGAVAAVAAAIFSAIAIQLVRSIQQRHPRHPRI